MKRKYLAIAIGSLIIAAPSSFADQTVKTSFIVDPSIGQVVLDADGNWVPAPRVHKVQVLEDQAPAIVLNPLNLKPTMPVLPMPALPKVVLAPAAPVTEQDNSDTVEQPVAAAPAMNAPRIGKKTIMYIDGKQVSETDSGNVPTGLAPIDPAAMKALGGSSSVLPASFMQQPAAQAAAPTTSSQAVPSARVIGAAVTPSSVTGPAPAPVAAQVQTPVQASASNDMVAPTNLFTNQPLHFQLPAGLQHQGATGQAVPTSATGPAPAQEPAQQSQPQAQQGNGLSPEQQASVANQTADNQELNDAVQNLNQVQQHVDVPNSVSCTDDTHADAYSRYDDKASGKLRLKGDERIKKLNAAFDTLAKQADADALDDSKMKFWEKVNHKDYSLPAKLAKKASCIMVIPGEKSIAFGSLGFTYGAGAYKCKDPSSSDGWGKVHFVQAEGISKGFQIGGKSTDRVMFFDGEDAINQLEASTIKACAGAAVAVGPYGRDAQACTDASLKPIVSYSSTEGLFAGVSLQGVRIHPDKNMDALENNQEVSMQKRHWYTLGLRAGHRSICASPQASDQVAGNASQSTGGQQAVAQGQGSTASNVTE